MKDHYCEPESRLWQAKKIYLTSKRSFNKNKLFSLTDSHFSISLTMNRINHLTFYTSSFINVSQISNSARFDFAHDLIKGRVMIFTGYQKISNLLMTYSLRSTKAWTGWCLFKCKNIERVKIDQWAHAKTK